MTFDAEPVAAAELVTCQTCNTGLMCAPGHPEHLEHCRDGSHTVHVGRLPILPPRAAGER